MHDSNERFVKQGFNLILTGDLPVRNCPNKLAFP